ncbi:MAG: hypothetical protein ACTSR3_14695 [Candidatus Helarchaeota archaeon]
MARKRIGWFRKKLGNVGKKLIRWKFRKMDLYILSLMELEVLKKYAEILGDQGTAFDVFNEQFQQGAYDIFYSVMDLVKIFFSKDLRDLLYIYDLAMYIILGNDYKEFFAPPKFISADEAEDGIPKIIARTKKCIMCASVRGEEDIKLDELGDRGFAEILGNALTALIQLAQDSVGNPYQVVQKETKCFLRGDTYGEMTVYFYPKEEENDSEEKTENEFEEEIEWE